MFLTVLCVRSATCCVVALQETEAAVDATVQKVMADVDPLEAAWQAELQRLQVGLEPLCVVLALL